MDRKTPEIDAPEITDDYTPRPLAARLPVKPDSASWIEWIGWFAAFLIPELLAVFGHHPLRTLSYSLRFATGTQYTIRWVVLFGAMAGLVTWLIPHIGWYVGPKWLLYLTIIWWVGLGILSVVLHIYWHTSLG